MDVESTLWNVDVHKGFGQKFSYGPLNAILQQMPSSSPQNLPQSKVEDCFVFCSVCTLAASPITMLCLKPALNQDYRSLMRQDNVKNEEKRLSVEK